jgi:hypothetical protein
MLDKISLETIFLLKSYISLIAISDRLLDLSNPLLFLLIEYGGSFVLFNVYVIYSRSSYTCPVNFFCFETHKLKKWTPCFFVNNDFVSLFLSSENFRFSFSEGFGI